MQQMWSDGKGVFFNRGGYTSFNGLYVLSVHHVTVISNDGRLMVVRAAKAANTRWDFYWLYKLRGDALVLQAYSCLIVVKFLLLTALWSFWEREWCTRHNVYRLLYNK